jgi:hypothetical protein
MISITFDTGFDLSLKSFILGWEFGNKKLRYWNLKNYQPYTFHYFKKIAMNLHGKFICKNRVTQLYIHSNWFKWKNFL